ncbi:MAG: 3'-5' exoribonuclease [Bacteroidales bacterium]|nr:3'-5' exoribonuclease [Bacteroidales bacterium]
MKDFAAIDFETANECPSSVCSVGVVVVRGGEIVEKFYSLIHPEPEYYAWFCRQVHGLGPEDTEDAPVFPFVWSRVEPLIEGLPLVAHNAGFDQGCLKEVFKVYQMDYPDYDFLDTLGATKISSRFLSFLASDVIVEVSRVTSLAVFGYYQRKMVCDVIKWGARVISRI